jgi:hypothetical protein
VQFLQDGPDEHLGDVGVDEALLGDAGLQVQAVFEADLRKREHASPDGELDGAFDFFEGLETHVRGLL